MLGTLWKALRPPMPHLRCARFALAGGAAGAGDELHSFIQEMAEKALLGLGDARLIYPTTLDDLYAAYADETPGRVML